jgi:hypothetical protein
MQAGQSASLGDVFGHVADALSGLGAGTTSEAILAVAGAGVIAAAVVQLAKELTPLRRWYQERWLGGWILRHATSTSVLCAEKQLVHLATGNCSHAFYELPAEEMALHINQAGQITLDAPSDYDCLIRVLAHGMDPTDLATLLQGPIAAGSQPYFDARNRVARRIQRNVEGLRLGLGRDWRFWMHIVSVLLTTLAVTGTVAYGTYGTNWYWSAVLLSVPIGVVGGYFAPITHDLVKALEKLRKWSP